MSLDKRVSPFTPSYPTKPAERQHWGRLYGAAKSLAISQLAAEHDGLLVIITSESIDVHHFETELKFFLGDDSDVPVMLFPDWETLPYDAFSPYQDIISQRLATLASLHDVKKGILVLPITTVMHYLMPRDYLFANSFIMQVGDTLDLEKFKSKLLSNGYNITSQVVEHGDLAIRGSLVDIFPMGSELPYRIDLFDDQIDTIRTFDSETQRSNDKINKINILPAREVALTDQGIANFRSQWRNLFEGNPAQCPVYRDVSQGLAPSGIEYYLPLFYQETNTLFDYLPDQSLMLIDEDCYGSSEKFWQDIEERYEQMRYDIERPILEPSKMFIANNKLFERLKQFPQIHMSAMEQAKSQALNFSTVLPTKLPIDARAAEPLALVKRYIDQFPGKVLFTAETIGRRETLIELFRQHDLYPKQLESWNHFVASDDPIAITVAPLEKGLQTEQPDLAIISEPQLFGDRVMQRRLRKRKKQDSDAIIRNLTELTVGAPVVHEEHGVGRYQGLVTLEAGGILSEYIMLEYDQGDKLYVPVSSLDLVSRYTGVDPEHAPLHRLGSGAWEKARKKAAQRVCDVAAELLDMHAKRAARQGVSFDIEDESYRAFVQGFPFEETPGQQDAINDVLKDMNDEKPMDRLVCGDAGFGKTEVALRAAFIAVQNGKQVALLVPTTLLAQQHFQNFSDRFADWPVKVELISRFRTSKEQDKVIEGLKDGKIDIVIGTHKLILGDIKFKDLGLLIIDEEHRFGVRQKEKFKALRSEIDVLTLTATPIPRTLNMALSNLRELSIISTPPSRRLSVKTFVREWDNALLKEAIMRELKRGGQVYFLHNRVESIEATAKKIQELMPEARIETAHGQMPEKELERIMSDFYHRRFNILVSTTIIETGIDVPNANTIIIDRADKFGLAQLYQLRGRVGRSHHRAYAYLIIPDRKSVTKDAIKRLEAIESLEDLGIGFTLATHDLEIRGSGEILGDEQSGHIQEVGFGLYMELLERAVKALQSGQQPELDRSLDHGAEINLHAAALIPEDYLPDVHNRLIFYKRIASAKDKTELKELQVEMIDRFGLLPEPIQNLFDITELKLQANPIGIKKIEMGGNGGRVVFQAETKLDPAKIIELIQTQPSIYKLDGNDKLRVSKELPEFADRHEELTHLLNHIVDQTVLNQ